MTNLCQLLKEQFLDGVAPSKQIKDQPKSEEQQLTSIKSSEKTKPPFMF